MQLPATHRSGKSTEAKRYHKLYGHRWQVRREKFLRLHPICADPFGVHRYAVIATVADHIVDHKGDWWKFTFGELQPLCATCHNRKTKLENPTGWSVQ